MKVLREFLKWSLRLLPVLIAVACYYLFSNFNNVNDLKDRQFRVQTVAEEVSNFTKRSTSCVALNSSNIEKNMCYCPAETVDQFAPQMLQLLNVVTSSAYFRYYKIITDKPCPYWAVSLICTSAENTCSVCKCNEDSVPTVLRTSSDMSDLKTPNSLISQLVPHPSNADSWGAWLNDDLGEAEYIDLIQNPEGNTGYSGPLAANVWKAIYQENCFPLENRKSCNAFKLPRTLFSGLHTSILIHVATNFYKDTGYESPNLAAGIYNNQNISYLPNCDFFLSHVAPRTEFLENLYVLYQFVFRSLALGKDSFLSHMEVYNSGEGGRETEEDQVLKGTLEEFFSSPYLLTLHTFDEKQLLENVRPQHFEAIQSMLSNVTSLMDCVTCEKCRIWGKLETKGIATAMEIVFTNGTTMLDRAQRVSLMNLARQVAFSIRSIQYMSNLCHKGIH